MEFTEFAHLSQLGCHLWSGGGPFWHRRWYHQGASHACIRYVHPKVLPFSVERFYLMPVLVLMIKAFSLLFLPVGVHPAVARATTAGMILFTTATATISYAIRGMLPVDYAIFCFMVGSIVTYTGQAILLVLMGKNQRHSYIAYSLGLVVLISAHAMSAESIVALMA
jgi:hypothetical protein